MLTYDQAQAIASEFFGNGVLFHDRTVTNFQVERHGDEGVHFWVTTPDGEGYQYISQSDLSNVTDSAGIALRY